MCAAIEARLTDPALDAGAVATAAGISVRYVNAVLAREGTSIVRLIQARRLARCRKALEDPLQSHRTLSEIAYGWGFSDMTHSLAIAVAPEGGLDVNNPAPNYRIRSDSLTQFRAKFPGHRHVRPISWSGPFRT
jgi:AraC-like DNA-binding protein